MTNFKVLLLAVLILAPLNGLAQVSNPDDKSALVREFLEAFNAHDAPAMAALVAEDVQWLSVRGSALSVEVEGRAALAAAMAEYFSACPTCRSEIHSLIASNERVSVVEVASWVSADGPKSQRSIAVYEFSGPLIQGVYYFPEEAGLAGSR